LSIITNAFAERLQFDTTGVRGVLARTSEGLKSFRGCEIVVAGGAILSPALLLRSGLGPAAPLRDLGIAVVRDLPGVGGNLQNHVEVTVVTHLPRDAVQDRAQRSWQQNCLRFSSRIANCPDRDMFLVSMNKASWHPLGARIGALGVYVYKPYSKGVVALKSAHPAVAPAVRFNLLDDARDLDRLEVGLRLALNVLNDPQVRARRHEVFLPNGKIVLRMNRRNRRSWFQTYAIARLLDIAPLRRLLLKGSTLDLEGLLRSDEERRALIRRRAQPVHHVCGTCRMGPANDPQSVVDSHCRVRGVGGLRVIDASIFPTIPRANTHFPVIMAAEKAADQIKSDWLRSGVERVHPAPLSDVEGVP
jgi:5-(hydroxymethyl)furfural/furfural oxidase